MKEFHIHVISVIIGADAVLKAIQSQFMKEFHIHVIIVIVDQYISCDIILFTCVGFIQDAIIFNLFKNIYQIPPPPDPQRFTQSKFFPIKMSDPLPIMKNAEIFKIQISIYSDLKKII